MNNTLDNSCMNKMQDGRSFTDYRPRCTVQYQMQDKLPKSSYDNRMYLMNNAEKLMKANIETVSRINKCTDKSCMPLDITPPNANTFKCNGKTCSKSNTNQPNGIGTGRNYSTF